MQEQEGIAVSLQCLTYEGTQWEDGQTAREVNVQEGATISLQLRPRG